MAQELVKSNAAEEINQVEAVAQELDDAAQEIDQVESQEKSVHASSEVVKDTEIQIEDDGLIGEQIESTDDELSIEFKRKKRQTYFPDVSSNHPLEVGIVRSKDGTVAAGVVLSGIAAGLEYQSVQVLIKMLTMCKCQRLKCQPFEFNSSKISLTMSSWRYLQRRWNEVWTVLGSLLWQVLGQF